MKLKTWNSLWSIPKQTIVSNVYMHWKNSFISIEEFLSSKEICPPERHIIPWVLVNLSTWRWTIPPVFQETKHEGCTCAARSTGLRAACKAAATATWEPGPSGCQEVQYVIPKGKNSTNSPFVKKEVETIIHLRVSEENTLRKTSNYLLCVG